jgi:hypothetical protein
LEIDMTNQTLNLYTIDVETQDANALYRRLKKLKSTVAIEKPSQYHQDRSYSQVKLDSSLSFERLDRWLYKSKLNYVGPTVRQTYLKADGYLFDQIAKPISPPQETGMDGELVITYFGALDDGSLSNARATTTVHGSWFASMQEVEDRIAAEKLDPSVISAEWV